MNLNKEQKKEVCELLDTLIEYTFSNGRTPKDLGQFKRDNGLIEEPFFGKWVKQYLSSQDGFIYGVFKGYGKETYGINTEGEWSTRITLHEPSAYFCKDIITPIEHQEVKDALIKHWEKDNEGFEFYNWHQDDRCGMEGMLYGWNKLDIDSEMKPLFDNGKWFPIEKPTTVKQEPLEEKCKRFIDTLGSLGKSIDELKEALNKK
jgi:hypothetical protein